MQNILFSYLYRDGANYKNYSEVVFANPDNIDVSQVKEAISTSLVDGEWFYAKPWQLPDLHFEKWDEEIDHQLHEFESVAYTSEAPTDYRTIAQFLAEIKKQGFSLSTS